MLNKVLLIILIIFISILFLYFVISHLCIEKDVIEKLDELKNVCKANITELSIVSERSYKLYYIKITNPKIINEFKRIIVKETFDPNQKILQFDDSDIISIKFNNIYYSIEILTSPSDPGFIKSNTADIVFFSDGNLFNAYNELDNNVYNWEFSFSNNIMDKYGFSDACYQFRNYALYDFIDKYINETILNNGKNDYGILFQARNEKP